MQKLNLKLAQQLKNISIWSHARSPLTTDIDQFMEQNEIGIALFLKFSKYTAITFGILSMLSLYPLTVFNNGGGMVKYRDASVFDIQSKMAKMTLGNLDPTDRDDSKGNLEFEFIILFDLLMVSIVYGFYYWFRKNVDKIKNKIQLKPNMYTMEVQGFPSTLIDTDIIKGFFEKHGYQLYKCYFARNYHDTLYHHKKIVDIQYELEEFQKENNARLENKQEKKDFYQILAKYLPCIFDYEKIYTKKYEKTKTQVNNSVKKLLGEKKRLMHWEYPSLKAYVVFKYPRERDEAYKKFKKLELPQFLFNHEKLKNLTYKISDIKETDLLEGKYNIKVNKKVDQPGDIRWENLEISNFSRFLRLSGVFVIIVIACILFHLILSGMFPKTEIIGCNTEAWKKSAINWDNFIPSMDGEQSCSDNFWSSIGLVITNTIFAIFLISFNSVLRYIVQTYKVFMRYTSQNRENRGQIFFIFISQFINTAVLVAYVHSYAHDFDRDFYVYAGSRIVFVMLINMLSPYIYCILGIRLSNKIRELLAKQRKTQWKMNQAITPPQFDIMAGYAVSLNTIFLTLFFCTGIPILLPIGAAALIIQYWSYKYQILRLNKKPQQYNYAITKRALDILPISLFVHLIMAIFMFGEPTIFQIRNYGHVSNGLMEGFGGLDTFLNSIEITFIKRLFHTWAYTFYVFIVFSIVYLYKFGKYIIPKIVALYRKLRKMEKVEQRPNFLSYAKALPKMSEEIFSSYNIRKNPDYEYMLEKIDYQTNFDKNIPEADRQIAYENKLKQIVAQKKLEQKVELRDQFEIYKKNHKEYLEKRLTIKEKQRIKKMEQKILLGKKVNEKEEEHKKRVNIVLFEDEQWEDFNFNEEIDEELKKQKSDDCEIQSHISKKDMDSQQKLVSSDKSEEVSALAQQTTQHNVTQNVDTTNHLDNSQNTNRKFVNNTIVQESGRVKDEIFDSPLKRKSTFKSKSKPKNKKKA